MLNWKISCVQGLLVATVLFIVGLTMNMALWWILMALINFMMTTVRQTINPFNEITERK